MDESFLDLRNFSGGNIVDSATPHLGYELTGARSASYKNLRVLRAFVVRTYSPLVAA
jgi:hypothetical protein